MCAKKYLAQVRRHLTCSAASQQRLLDQAEQMVADLLQETPDGDEQALAAAFGPPREFARQMLSTLDPAEIAAVKRRKMWLCRGGMFALILVLITVAAVCFARWQKLQKIIPPDVYVVIEPAQTITPEEFYQIHNDQSIPWEGEP